jgi:DNA-binding PadR family transcriptional regulator
MKTVMKIEIEDPKYWRLLINQSLLRFFLLKALSEKEQHGYGLQSALTLISNGLCKPSQGTIYPALKELEKNGYVKGTWKKVKNRKRKIYLLTEKGKRAKDVAAEVLEKALKSISREEKQIKEPKLPFEF